MFELSWDNPYEITPVTFVPVGDRFAEIDAEDWGRVRDYKWYPLNGYTNTFIYPEGKQKGIYMHRLIMNVEDRNVHIDHRNFEGMDNRKSNLRSASISQNQQHQRRLKPKKMSPYKGVYYHPYCQRGTVTYAREKPWEVRICVLKKTIFLGTYKTKEEAALAYNDAALKYFGEFAYINKIEIGEVNPDGTK